MLMVPIDEAREGMRLATPVAHPEKPGHDLLRAGFALTTDVIDRLRVVGVTSVFVDYPELAELDRFMAPYLSQERQVVYRQVRDTLAAAQKATRPTVAFPEYYSSTRELIITLMHGGQHPVYLDLAGGTYVRPETGGLTLTGSLTEDETRHPMDPEMLGAAVALEAAIETLGRTSRAMPALADARYRSGYAGAFDINRGSAPLSRRAADDRTWRGDLLAAVLHVSSRGRPRCADGWRARGHAARAFACRVAARSGASRLRHQDVASRPQRADCRDHVPAGHDSDGHAERPVGGGRGVVYP